MRRLFFAALAMSAALATGVAIGQELSVHYEINFSEAEANGITAAREQYNLDNPETPIELNQEYVQFVMRHAAHSYCMQYEVEGC